MRRPELQTLERLRHWQGEQLKRSDLSDQRAYDARRAGWHNRSLHETFGSVEGLEVALASGSVVVQPGLGYDALGNPVWLDQVFRMPLPSGPGPQYLVLGAPRGDGPGALSHGLAWVPESEFLAEDGLPLAAHSDGTLEPCRPRRVRALRRPALHTGETIRGRTPWEIWEVSAPGKAAKIQAGVQTRIDASAAGFTRTPHYFASLQAPVWSASAAQRPDFAPSYLAHVANPTPEGFTFRLLLKDIALRRVGVLEVTGQVSRIVKASFETMSVELETAQPFVPGDAIVLVRPRATRACTIRESAAELLTLDAPMPLPSGTRVAFGNLPRRSQVIAFEPTTLTRLRIDEGPLPERGAVLAFSFEGTPTSAARVASVSGSELVLDRLWALPAEALELRAWPAESPPIAVEKVDGTKLQVGSSTIEKGDWVIALAPQTSALSRPVLVTLANKGKITLAEPIPGLARGARLLALRQPLQATVIGATSDASIATLSDPAPFLMGDLVAVQGGSAPGIVLGIEEDRATIQHGADFTLAAGDVLVGANWERATTVLSSFSATSLLQVLRVSGTDALRIDDLLYAWRDASTTPTAPVAPELRRLNVIKLLPASELVFTSRAEILARGDVVLVARFPCVTSLVAVENEQQLRFASAGLAEGDWIAPLEGAGAFRLVQLTRQLEADLFLTSTSVDPALVGSSFGVVHFGSIGTVGPAQADDPENSLRLERPPNVRAAGDFVGPWTHFFDTSAVSIVDQVSDKRLVLSAGASTRFAGDGVVPNGLIDGGVLALASLSPDQRRLAVEQALAVGDEITASGPGPLGDEQAVEMSVSQSDPATARVVLDPRVGVTNYSLRPERLNLLSAFNERFPELFALFAQKQGLYVAWTACEDFEPSPLEVEPPRKGPCHDNEEDPCPCQA